MPNEKELVQCPITGQVKIGKNVDIYGATGGAAGSRKMLRMNDWRKQIGGNAFFVSTVDNDQNRLKTFLVSSNRFNVTDFDSDLRTSMHTEIFNPHKNTNTGRLTEVGLQKHILLKSIQNNFNYDSNYQYDSRQDYEDNPYSSMK